MFSRPIMGQPLVDAAVDSSPTCFECAERGVRTLTYYGECPVCTDLLRRIIGDV